MTQLLPVALRQKREILARIPAAVCHPAVPDARSVNASLAHKKNGLGHIGRLSLENISAFRRGVKRERLGGG